MSKKIAVKKRGNELGFQIFMVSTRLFGLRGAYGLLYLVCTYYLLFDRAAVKGALAYLEKRFKEEGFLKKHWRAYLLFVNQGKALIDRYAIASGCEKFTMQLKGFDSVKEIVSQNKKGCIFLTSHVGNWQVALSCLKELDKDIYLVMRPEDNVAVKKYLEIDSEKEKLRIISPEQDFGGVIEATEKINNGSIVAIMGDRRYGFPSLEVDYLAEKADFPFGAFSIAASLECPVVILLTAKLSHKEYLVDFNNVLWPKYEGKKEKRQQLKEYVQKYAMVLSNYAERYPYQVFLFADVWSKK